MPLDTTTVGSLQSIANQFPSPMQLGSGVLDFYADKKMADYQYKRNLEQWNRVNEYNSPSNQMRRLAEAGLNPNLVYGNINNMPAQQAINYSTHPNSLMGIKQSPVELFQMAQQAKMNDAQIKTMETQRSVMEANKDLAVMRETLAFIDSQLKSHEGYNKYGEGFGGQGIDENAKNWMARPGSLVWYDKQIKQQLAETALRTATKIKLTNWWLEEKNAQWENYGTNIDQQDRFYLRSGAKMIDNLLKGKFGGK